MKQVWLRLISRASLVLASLLSCVHVPVGMYADVCCEDADFESGCCSDWKCDALWIGGAAILGGVAGAVAASTENHRGHRGDPGSTGPVGPPGPMGPPGTPFIPDTGETLIFNFELELGVALLEAPAILPGDTATPFVIAPDGTAYVGTPTPLDLIVAPFVSAITVPNPLFGEYQAGLSLQLDGSVVPIGADVFLNIAVTASRDGSVTYLALPRPALALTVGEAEISANFGYTPNLAVP